MVTSVALVTFQYQETATDAAHPTGYHHGVRPPASGGLEIFTPS
jgi:hypothetical protein